MDNEFKAHSCRNALFITFIAVLLLVTFSNVYFIVFNDVPQSWDPALHMYYSLIYSHLLQNLDFGRITHVSNYYPPFFHITSAILYLFVGFSEKIAISTNFLFYIVLIYSIFKIGEKLKDWKTGVVSAITISILPGTIEFQRVYMLDFALMSLLALSVYLYLASRDFRDAKYSLLFGVVFGFSELTKWNAFIYIIPYQ